MTDPTFRAKIRPELHPAAQELVRVYESVPGSTGPGCCPEALAAVLVRIAALECIDLSMWAELLCGEQP